MRPRSAGTLPRGGADAVLEQRLAATRARTHGLVAGVSEEDLDRVHSPLLSPLVWDLGHIAAFEDLWVCQTAGFEPLRPHLMEVYDATETPRAERGDLPYLRHGEAIAFMDEVRARTLQALAAEPSSFVWEMLIQHEQQHNETMLQTMQIAGLPRPDNIEAPAPESADAMGLVPGGPFAMGTDTPGFVYDNERPEHEVDVAAFRIDLTPVSCGAFLTWMEDGGYSRREWWSDDGWAWRESEGVERPLYWDGDGRVRSFDRLGPIDPERPVMNVSWFEAEAFARAHGKRLPTEAEWEKAASRGVLRGAGQVWEWTASEFAGYPGFVAFPYPEYSEVFFGEGYRVLRGGSWATHPDVARTTFRNWDWPLRRQIFAGFRCAEDA